MDLTLNRVKRTDRCTQGTLCLPAGPTLQTLELPWKDASENPGGDAGLSCVPPGLYTLEKHDTLKHPQTFALVNPNLGVFHEPDPAYPAARVACLIHVANYPEQLEGCIGVGMSAGVCVLSSSDDALRHFKAVVPWEAGHTLTITDPPADPPEGASA